MKIKTVTKIVKRKSLLYSEGGFRQRECSKLRFQDLQNKKSNFRSVQDNKCASMIDFWNVLKINLVIDNFLRMITK